MDDLQSTYRRGHGTKTALLHINSDVDIDMILTKGCGALLMLLDLFAAFDTSIISFC